MVDDANDFNDDYSIYDVLSRAEAEGNVTEEARATGQKQAESNIYGAFGAGSIGDDDDGYTGYSGGKRGKIIFTSFTYLIKSKHQTISTYPNNSCR